jgi:hypothetical protein
MYLIRTTLSSLILPSFLVVEFATLATADGCITVAVHPIATPNIYIPAAFLIDPELHPRLLFDRSGDGSTVNLIPQSGHRVGPTLSIAVLRANKHTSGEDDKARRSSLQLRGERVTEQPAKA